jgi:hypothetical protein
MLVIDCPCGHRLEAPDEEGLVIRARDHVEEHHPDLQRTDEQLRRRVAADAYEVHGDAEPA